MAYGVRVCNMAPHHGEGRDRNGRLWRWEFGAYVGPLFVDKRGVPLKQPDHERHPAWEPFERWYAEHAKLIAEGCCLSEGVSRESPA